MSAKTVISNLLAYVNTNECTHEDVHRGGVMWTICDSCGRKWADDQGGFQPYVAPAAIADAEKFLTPKVSDMMVVVELMRLIDAYAYDYQTDGKLAYTRADVQRQLLAIIQNN